MLHCLKTKFLEPLSVPVPFFSIYTSAKETMPPRPHHCECVPNGTHSICHIWKASASLTILKVSEQMAQFSGKQMAE